MDYKRIIGGYSSIKIPFTSPRPNGAGERALRPIGRAPAAFDAVPFLSSGARPMLTRATWDWPSAGLGVRIRVGILQRKPAPLVPSIGRIPAAWSRAAVPVGPPWFLGLALYDGTARELHDMVRSCGVELDERTSEKVLLSYVGDPREAHPWYAALRDAPLQASDGQDAQALAEEMSKGVDRDFIRQREVEGLIALTGVDRRALPCFAFYPYPIYAPPAVLPIRRDWISSPKAQRRLLDTLLDFFTITDLEHLAKACGTNAKLARRFEELIVEYVVDALTGAPISEDPDEACIFRREGATWLVMYGGLRRSIAHSLGMAYIFHLLQNPERPIRAAVLRDIVAGREDAALLGSAGDVLDGRAMDQYRQRLLSLGEERREAELNNDLATVQRLDEETQRLTAEIGRARGLHGVRRKAADDHERARKSVSKAIHSALCAIKEHHTPLWQHFDRFLEIGLTLTYRPERHTSWSA